MSVGAALLSIVLLLLQLASAAMAFSPSCRSNVALYWGQNSMGTKLPKAEWEKPLEAYCADDSFDILILSFLITFDPKDPNLNFSFHCDTVCKDRSSVLCCPSIGSAIRQCQKNKKIVLLSLGGAAGTYFFTSEDAAKQFADGIWNMFLGGTSGDLRPFGPGVILNGVDLDIEGGISQGYGSFVDRLRARFGETPKRKFYITGAPQCPFPDFFLGPDGPLNTRSALDHSKFDAIFVQFYNNYCQVSSSSFNFDTWGSWSANSTFKPKVFIGMPSSPSSCSSGYLEYGQATKVIEANMDKDSFGGVMFWDAGGSTANLMNGVEYGTAISKFLKTKTTRPFMARTCGFNRTLVFTGTSNYTAAP